MSITREYTITFEECRCPDCRRFYAIEDSGPYRSQLCPWCAVGKVLELRKRIDHMANVERGLRAALKRRKSSTPKALPRGAS